MTTLIISKQDDGGSQRIGTLAFADGAEPVLSVENEGSDAEALRKAWAETSAIDKLPMSHTESGENESGKPVMRFGEVLVPRGDEEYKWAVYEYLDRTYGYEMEVAE